MATRKAGHDEPTRDYKQDLRETARTALLLLPGKLCLGILFGVSCA